ncbi:MAG TPA: pyridoxamine 5'-phosphate oxidase family protein [Candidatus Binatus sp.]|nr:pyridoxamine 5'-phosphate oxidase family protein [Candidatus Binatus sp.]
MPDPEAAPAPAALTAEVRDFLRGARIATIATADEAGSPHQAAIWFRLEPDDRILVNSLDGRRWPRQLEASRRCSLAVIDEADRYRWLAVAAALEEVDRSSAAREDIVALSVHYDDASDAGAIRFRSQARVSFRLRITSIHAELGSGPSASACFRGRRPRTGPRSAMPRSRPRPLAGTRSGCGTT